MISWAGKSSDSCNVVVQHYPNRPLPRRKYETVSIPGRNGNLIFSQDAFDNVTQEYDIYISAERPKLPTVARKVAEWLLKPGYNVLFDSYEPTIFRLAYYSGEEDIENVFNRFGRMKILFSCKPQRFLLTGEDPVTMNAGGQIFNPTSFRAKPIIRVNGNGNGTLTVGSLTCQLTGISEFITIDSELQDCYKNLQNENAKFTGEFPVFEEGLNDISWTGGITGVVITPRWWML